MRIVQIFMKTIWCLLVWFGMELSLVIHNKPRDFFRSRNFNLYKFSSMVDVNLLCFGHLAHSYLRAKFLKSIWRKRYKNRKKEDRLFCWLFHNQDCFNFYYAWRIGNSMMETWQICYGYPYELFEKKSWPKIPFNFISSFMQNPACAV